MSITNLGGPGSHGSGYSGSASVVWLPEFEQVFFAGPRLGDEGFAWGGHWPASLSAAGWNWRGSWRAARLGLSGVSSPGELGCQQHLAGHLVVGFSVAEPGLAGGAGLIRAVGAGGGAVTFVVSGDVQRADEGVDFGVGEDDRVVFFGDGWFWARVRGRRWRR